MNVLPPLVAVILGVFAYWLNRQLGGPAVFNTIIIVVVAIVVLIWLLATLGVLGDLYLGPPVADVD
jgi:hypothetical protein